jgi:uncharacterized repeat protein (TIGR02543 family)
MPKVDLKPWGFRVRKAVIASLILPFFTVVSAPPAAATTACVEGTHFNRLSADGAATVVYRFTNTSAECTYTLPTGLTTAAILAVGAGGGGGGDGGGGGGGGELRYNATQSLAGVSSLAIWVGTGGSGQIGAWGGSGTGNGSSTTVKWNSTTKYQANGGGRSSVWSNTGPPGGAGGTGGLGGNANSNGQAGGFGPYSICQLGSSPTGTTPSNSITGSSVDYGGGGGGGFGRNDSGSTPFLGVVGGGSSGGRGANYRRAFDGTTAITGSTRGYNGAEFTGGGGGGGSACNSGTQDLVNQRTAGGDGAHGVVIISFSRVAQSITFDSIADRKLRAGTFNLSPTASSGLTVALTSATPSVCTVSGMTVTPVSVGTCTLNANQAGNNNYLAATQVQRSFSLTATTLTFSSNDGTSTNITQSISTTGSVALRANTFTRSAFRFLRWDTNANGQGTPYLNSASVSFVDDTTLHAIWNSSISYDPNTATSTRAIESTTATGTAGNTTLSNGKLVPGSPVATNLLFNLNAADSSSVSGSTWVDINRNGVSAALVGSPTYNSQEGFFQLNGTSQYMNLGSSLLDFQGTSNYTVSAMFKSDKPAESEQGIFSRWNDNVSGIFIIRNWGSKVETYRNYYGSLPSTTNYNEGDINYVTATYNGSTLRLFLNGVLQAEAASTGSMFNQPATDVLIGATKSSNALSRYFQGKIYSVQAYNRALSQSEINQNYQALLPGQKVSKTNFTLVPWNTSSAGTGTAIGTTVTDLSALPAPYLRLQPSNYNPLLPEASRWSSTPGSSSFTYRGTPELIASNNGRFGATGNFPAIGGTTSVGFTLGNPQLTTYTLCVVARYRGLSATPGTAASQGRIIGGTTGDWISGFHNANVSEFHHINGYNFDSTRTDLNWHYYCDSGNRAFWDGVKVTPWTNQATTYLPNIAINNWGSGQYSDWELADLIIYDQFLPDSQIEQINRYFKNTYGILAGPSSTAAAVSVSPSTTYASSGDTTLFANWGSAITYDGNKQSSGTAPSPSLITGISGSLASNSGTLVRAGFRFDGWNTNESGTGITYAAGSSYPNTGNITLYAKWTLPTVFPTSTSVIEPNNLLPYMRYKASDYDATAKTWRDSSGNARNVSLINGSPSVVSTTANTNGSSKAIQVLQGVTTDQITFDNPTTTNGRYTLFSLIRYNSTTASKQQRTLNSIDNTWHTGQHGQKAGVSYHEGTWLKSVSTVTPVTNWVLSTDYTSSYRSNGNQITVENTGGANLRRLGINTYAAEASDFQVAEIILYDRALTPTEIRQVEEYLAFTYGITAYALTGTYSTSSALAIGAGVGGRSETLTATNGLGNKTITMSPSRSGITLETTTANSANVVVSPTAATGVYVQTLTATDTTGEAVTHTITITVNPSVRFDTSTATTLITTHRRGATLRLNTVFGVGTKVFTMTSAGTGITLDTSTAAASGFATLRVDTFTATGTYTQVITVTDDTRIRSTYTVTITINGPPTISSTSAITTTPVTSGLRLNLDAGDPASYSGSGTAWTDLSGNGNNATWQVSPTFTKDFGGGFTQTGATNQYATTPNLGTTDILSVETWVKFDSLNTSNNYPCVVSDAYVGTLIGYSICFHADNQLRGAYHRSSFTVTPGFTPVVGTWYHVVYTVSKSGSNYISSLYQNGNLVGSTTAAMIPGNSTGVTYIGRRWNAAEYVKGTIPVVRVYNRVLSTTEITQNYNALLPRFTNNPTNSVTITTTESVTASSSIYYGGLGTGNKTFSLTNPTAGISIDTSTVNTVRLNAANTLTATSTTVARTINETITATDSNGVAAATRVFVTMVINPRIIITDATPGTLSTTFGRIAYDTFTATQGTGTKTFTVSSASFPSAFVMTNPSANTGLLTVANNLPAGTYPITVTATDSVGGVTTLALTVVVNPAPTIVGETGNTLTTTVTRSASLRINVVGGTGTRTISWTSPNTGITIDSSTLAAQNYITLRVETTTPTNTYAFSISAADSFSVRVSDTFTVIVNRWPVIGDSTLVSSGLRLNLDPSTYSGTGTWFDSSGNGFNAIPSSGATNPTGSSPAFVAESGGFFRYGTAGQGLRASSVGSMETFTVSAWVRVGQASHTGNPALVAEYSSGNVNYLIQFYNGRIVGSYFSGGNWIPNEPGFVPDLNVWTHVTYVVVKNGTGSYSNLIYKNGVLQQTTASSAQPSGNNGGVIIGRRWDTLANTFIGDVGAINIYNRSLSAAEILQNYNVQGSRYYSISPGRETLTVTQGVTGSLSGVVAFQGTGNKTLTLSNRNTGISIDTATANTFSLTLANTLTATSSTVARTLTETVTATDAAGATTARIYTVVINPPIRVESTTSVITTTSGIVAWDTFTATLGTGSYTFALAGTPNTNGFTLTQTNNRAVLRVGSTVNPGTYNLTITATDAVGAVTNVAKTVVVNNLPTISGNANVAGTTGYAFSSQSYSAANGTGTLTYSITTVPATVGRSTTGITLSTTTGSPTINVSTAVLPDTYTVTLRATDSLTAFGTFLITLRINETATITGSRTLTKVYGEDLSQVFATSGGTAPWNLYSFDICTSEKLTYVGNGENGTLNASYTAERFNGIGSCSWVVPKDVSNVSVLTVAGGGGGGGTSWAGGGGAGGVVFANSVTVTPAAALPIVVGAGGAGGANNDSCISGSSPSQGSNGNNSSFNSAFTAIGGGGGGGYGWSSRAGCGTGKPGGSGGGAGETDYNPVRATSTQATLGDPTGLGNSGGITTFLGGIQAGSGGGGAGAIGASTNLTSRDRIAGKGGDGFSFSITGSPVVYAGGGGGGTCNPCGNLPEGAIGVGGTGGGGNGGNNATGPVNGTNGLGGGGGGSQTGLGAAGGSGTVIVRYLTPPVDTQSARITMDTLSQSVGSIRLNAPRLLPVNTYTQTIRARDSGVTPATPSVVITVVVTKATPTLSLSLPGSVTTAKYGNPVTISAVATTPGTVAFVNGSSNITACTAVATTAGLATCSWTPTVVGPTTLRATLTPTDTANFNSSAQVDLPITVAKADTLTVTVGSLTRQYTGSAVAVTGAFTTNGLVAIDSLTAISMIYAGISNAGTPYSATTAPTNSGIYTISPNFPANASAYTFGVGSLGTTSALSNYESVTVVAGTLTINRAPQVLSFTYPNSNIATYSPTGTITASATTSLDSAARSYSSSTLTKCTIDSSTAVISIVEAGSCQVSMAVAQTFNYLADTATATVTINKASRTFSLTPAVGTLKYADTTTVTATLSAGSLDGTISYILGSPAGCTFDPLSGELLAISGTIQCPLTATISEGINYLAETTTAISLTIARANAPVITIDTITAMDHTPGAQALITPTYSVTGLKNLDAANSMTFTYSFISNPFETFTYSDTRTPIDAGTYRITPSALTLSTGLMSNYETPTYSSSAINFIINRIGQESVTIENTNGEVNVPFTMIARGGNTNGALSFTIVSGSACSVLGNQLRASEAGACVVTVTMAGNRNYLSITSETITVRVRNFVTIAIELPSNPNTGITIIPSTPLTKGPDSCATGCVPSITSISVFGATESQRVVITGLSFNGVNKVFFRLDTSSPTSDVEATTFDIDSDTQITVLVPVGLVIGEFYTIRVATPEKTSARFYELEILP